MKRIKKIILALLASFLTGSFIFALTANKEIKEAKAIELTVSSAGDSFKLLDTYYRLL